jgi:chaperonin GroEL (HSP60 family)
LFENTGMKNESVVDNASDLNSPFAVCKAIYDIVGPTLGPMGLYKMVVRKSGTPVVSKNSETILDEIDIEHPAYDLIRSYVSDNNSVYTTLELVLLGEMVGNAIELFDQGVHPTTIVDAYDMALERATESILSVSEEKTIDRGSLKQLIGTHLESRTIFDNSNALSDTMLDALCDGQGNQKIDTDNIEIYTASRKQVTDSTTIPGICIEKRRPVNYTQVPLPLCDASVLLTGDSLHPNESSHDMEIGIDNEQKNVMKEETKRKDKLAQRLANTGCDVIFSASRDNADHEIQQRLSEKNIAVFHQIDNDVLKKLSHVTGANEVMHLWDVSEADLGHADRVEKRGIGDETYTFVKNNNKSQTKTILLQAGTEQALDTYEVALEECLYLIDTFLQDRRIVPGGGASELSASISLRKQATSTDDRKQLAFGAYADALESIPRTLALNAGMNPIDTVAELRNKHDSGMAGFGVNCINGEVVDMFSDGNVKPFLSKISSIRLATETAILLLRIDGILLTDDNGVTKNKSSHQNTAQNPVQSESVTQD